YRLAQFPRWRSDGLYLPDGHGLIATDDGGHIMVRLGGFSIPAAGATGLFRLTHWMRFYTAAPEFSWLNETGAFGIGTFADDQAHVRYFAVAPAPGQESTHPDGVSLELLGTAQWQYPRYETIRLFDDLEGVGLADSVGEVTGGPLAGTWRGWHYPTYRRNGL